jgi:hypothetical protein
MNRKKSTLAYALDFISFLLENIEVREFANARSIVLFGSAARGGAGKSSDVDIFIDVLVESKAFEKKVSGIVNDFYGSERFRRYWKLQGMENEINCIVGKLDRWKDLKQSVIADGIVLYGKYKSALEGETFVLFYWDKITPESKRVLLSKKIYGYKYKGKKYSGLLDKTSSVKLGSNCIMVPLGDAQRLLDTFRGLKVQAKTIYLSRAE